MLCIYTCTPHSASGEEPSVFSQGCHMSTLLDIVAATPSPKPNSDVLLRERVQNSQKKMKAYYDSSNAVMTRI